MIQHGVADHQDAGLVRAGQDLADARSREFSIVHGTFDQGLITTDMDKKSNPARECQSKMDSSLARAFWVVAQPVCKVTTTSPEVIAAIADFMAISAVLSSPS
jgi:hypothetical protein